MRREHRGRVALDRLEPAKAVRVDHGGQVALGEQAPDERLPALAEARAERERARALRRSSKTSSIGRFTASSSRVSSTGSDSAGAATAT